MSDSTTKGEILDATVMILNRVIISQTCCIMRGTISSPGRASFNRQGISKNGRMAQSALLLARFLTWAMDRLQVIRTHLNFGGGVPGDHGRGEVKLLMGSMMTLMVCNRYVPFSRTKVISQVALSLGSPLGSASEAFAFPDFRVLLLHAMKRFRCTNLTPCVKLPQDSSRHSTSSAVLCFDFVVSGMTVWLLAPPSPGLCRWRKRYGEAQS